MRRVRRTCRVLTTLGQVQGSPQDATGESALCSLLRLRKRAGGHATLAQDDRFVAKGVARPAPARNTKGVAGTGTAGARTSAIARARVSPGRAVRGCFIGDAVSVNDPDIDAQISIDALRALLVRTRKGTRPAALQLGDLLEELDEWLADDRQWRHGQSQHWKTLIGDVSERLRFVASLGEGAVQKSLAARADELQGLRGELGNVDEDPDDALRRRLARVASGAREDAARPELLVSALARISSWARNNLDRSDHAASAFRDLASLQGHDQDVLLDRIDRVLADSSREVAALRGEAPPTDPHARAGVSSSDRLTMVRELLGQPPSRRGGVVWLEYLQARLSWPWVMPVGPAVTLFAHDFLRPTLHQAPNDQRIPVELREDAEARGFLSIWLDAYEAEKAVRADHEVYGDPRVFLRVELDEVPRTQLVPAAREVAEFLVAFGALGSDNHDIWVLSDSYYVVDGPSSTTYAAVSPDKARDQLPLDVTAAEIARHADAIGRHVPLRDRDLRIAGHLLVWLRQATSNDNPARLVLCDRVVEQVCGWAGISRPHRFVEAFLKPSWIYEQMRRSVQRAYRQLANDTRGAHKLTTVIEQPMDRPPFTLADHLPSINLKAVIESLDDLVDIAPPASAALVTLTRLSTRLSSASNAGDWLDELAKDFASRNARLRRTRNALMHGGPLVRATVDDAARFAETLAYFAIGPAVDLLLNEKDIVDGFLDRQHNYTRCFAELRRGTPPSEALFWA
jgi:hypothetical protein